jgi:beta-glucosidase-like glycosyl hydrolase
MAQLVVQGMQDQGVMACAKHYVLNNQGKVYIHSLHLMDSETSRFTLRLSETNRFTVSANADEV